MDCNSLLTTMEDLNESRDPKKMECIKCGVILNGVSEYTNHYRTFHAGLNPHNCSMCDINLPSVAEFKKHMQQHYDKPVTASGALDPQDSETLDSPPTLDIQASGSADTQAQQNEKPSNFSVTPSHCKRSAFLKASKRVKDLSNDQSEQSGNSSQDDSSEYEESGSSDGSDEKHRIKHLLNRPNQVRVSKKPQSTSFSCNKCQSTQPSVEMSKLCCAVGPFKCFVCQAPMESKTTFMNHLRDQHQIKTVFQSYSDVVLNEQLNTDKQKIAIEKVEKVEFQPVTHNTDLMTGAWFEKINNVGNVVIQCRICNIILPSMDVYIKHFNEHIVTRNGVSMFECNLCFELKSNLSGFLKHRRDHFSERRYAKQTEKTVYKVPEEADPIGMIDIDAPIKTEPDDRLGKDSSYITPCFKCTQCQTLQPSYEMAKVCCHTGKEFECLHCDKILLNRAALISHYTHRHNVKTSFLKSKSLSSKQMEQNREKETRFIKGQSAFKETTPTIRFQCKSCSYKTFSIAAFKLHQCKYNQGEAGLKTELDTSLVYSFDTFCKDPGKCKMIPAISKSGKRTIHYYCKLCNIQCDYMSLFKLHVLSKHKNLLKTGVRSLANPNACFVKKNEPTKSKSSKVKYKMGVLSMFNKVLKTLKSKNKTQQFYECKVCLKQIRKSSDLTKHKRTHKGIKFGRTQKGLQGASHSTYSEVENESTLDENKGKEETIDKIDENGSNSVQEDLRKGLPSFSCNRCDRKHPSHEKAVLCCETGILTCPVCQEKYTGKVSMNRHLCQAHNVVTRWPDTQDSKKDCSDDHCSIKVTNYKMTFQCNLCQKTCFTRKSFRQHYKYVHEKKTSESSLNKNTLSATKTKVEIVQKFIKPEPTMSASERKAGIDSKQEFSQTLVQDLKNAEINDQDLNDTYFERNMEDESDKEWIPSDDEQVDMETKNEEENDTNHQLEERSSAKSAKDKIFNNSTRARRRIWIKKTYCPKCDLTFKLESELNAHINLHDSYKLCVYCNCIRKNIVTHVKKAHSHKINEWKMKYQKNSDTDAVLVPTGAPDISCKLCTKTFKNPYKYSYHVHMHKGLKQCTICKKMVRPNNMAYHVNKFCRRYAYQAYGYKLSKTPQQNVTLAHKSTKVTVKVHCKKCGSQFQNMAELENHYKSDTLCFQKKPIAALSIIDVSQDTKAQHNQATAAKQRKQENRVQCNICFKVYDHKSALRAHSLSHNEKTKCDYCSRMLHVGMERHVTKFHRTKLAEWRMRHFPKIWKGKYVKNKFYYKDGRIGYRWHLKSTPKPNEEQQETDNDIEALNWVANYNPVQVQPQVGLNLQSNTQEIQPVNENNIQPYAHISQISRVTRPGDIHPSDESAVYPENAPKNKDEAVFEEIKIELNKEFEEDDNEFQPMIISVTSVQDQNEQPSSEADAVKNISTEHHDCSGMDYLTHVSDQEMTNRNNETIEESYQDVANNPGSEDPSRTSPTSLTINGELNHNANNGEHSQYKTITSLLERGSDNARPSDENELKNEDTISNYDKSAVVSNKELSPNLQKQILSPQITTQGLNTQANQNHNTHTNIDKTKHSHLSDSEVMNDIYSEKTEVVENTAENGAISQCKIIPENKAPKKPSSVMLEVSSDSVLAQHNGALYECKLCKIIFLNETVHWQHMSTHATSGQPFACNHCKNTFTNAIDFHAHFISKYQKHL